MSEIIVNIAARFDEQDLAETTAQILSTWDKDLVTHIKTMDNPELYLIDLEPDWLVENLKTSDTTIDIQLIGPPSPVGFGGFLKWLNHKGATDIEGSFYSNMVNHDPISFVFSDGQFRDLASEYTDEELNTRTLGGVSKLHDAASEGSIRTVESILLRGLLPIDVTDNKNQTPLYFAVRDGKSEMVSYLIGKGAAVNVRSELGISAMQIAIERGEVEIAKILLENGIERNEEIRLGVFKVLTLLDFALYHWQPEVADLLREFGIKQRTRIKLNFDCSHLKQVMDVWHAESDIAAIVKQLREMGIRTPTGDKKWTFRLLMRALDRHVKICLKNS